MAGPYERSRWVPALAGAVLTCTVVTACGEGSGTAGPSPSSPAPSTPTTSSPAKDSPSGETLVLRRHKTGGIAGLGGPGSVPELSLYSTGRALLAAEGPRGGLTEFRLKPDALRRLLGEARAAGLGRSHTVGSGGIADAITVVVTLGDAQTRIIQPESQAGPEAGFLQRLDPRAWSSSDQAGKPKPFTPAKTAVLAREGAGSGPVKAWRLAPLGEGEQVAGGICTLVAPKKVPSTSPGTAWRSEGKTYTVRLRPLLPDEHTCRDVT